MKMKIARKMKKFFASFLTITLSVIMFVTQTSASSIYTKSAVFAERPSIVTAIETITWDPEHSWFIFGIDLACYESGDVDYVEADLRVKIKYPTSATPDLYTRSGIFTYLNTDDSDELLIHLDEFDTGSYPVIITVDISYEIFFDNGTTDLYKYKYNATLFNSTFDSTRSVAE